jgi:hypothetical protein
MPRDNLAVYYEGAALCFGQFGTPALAYSVLEPLASASPCVTFYTKDDPSVPFYKTIPPMFYSRNPCDIADFMRKIVSDSDYASCFSHDSWQWAKENCSEEEYVKAFKEKMSLIKGGQK